MKTKSIFCILLIFSFLTIEPVCALTNADVKLSKIINSGDLLKLREKYPQLRDTVTVDMLNFYAQAQLAIAFNRPEDAVVPLDSLLINHQEEMGSSASIGVMAQSGMNYLNLGRYAEAGQVGERLVNALIGKIPFESLYTYHYMERIGKGLAQIPAPRLVRPNHDVSVPMSIDSLGRGVHCKIPVEVNGITKSFIFDTGCSFGNFVPEQYAKEVGLQILMDSIPVSGATIGYISVATTDSMKIGELVYYNPVFLVAPSNELNDSTLRFDGVLGYHFIRDAEEIIIDNTTQTFIFPAKITEENANMFLSSNIPFLKLTYKRKPFTILFDTGNVKSTMGSQFAETFPGAIKGLKEQNSIQGGFGGVTELKVVSLPEFHFKLDGTPVTLYNTIVNLGAPNNSQIYKGSLGADFVLSFKRLTINYKYMYLKGE